MTPVPDIIRDMYPDVESKVLPVIKARASRLKGISGVDVDDAIQEARIALLQAMTKFDFNSGEGDFAPYMSVVVINTCRALFAKSRQAQHMARVPVRDGDGWEMVPMNPVSMENYTVATDKPTPSTKSLGNKVAEALIDPAPLVDDSMMFRESAMKVGSFKAAMDERLADREQQVLRCRVDPPPGLIDQIESDGGDPAHPTNVDIAKYLGLNKAQMDWALYKIRNLFTEVASQDQFSDVFADLIKGTGWPTVHVSRGQCYNGDFVQRTLQTRHLDGMPVSDVEESCDCGTRRVIQYEWGAVVAVWRPGVCWTVVAEGQFNPRSGEVTGTLGARKLLPIEGYMQLAKALADTRRKDMGDTKKWDKFKILPHCVGDHEPDNEVCDGDGADEKPCVHRDTCVAFQIRMKDKGLKAGSYVVEKQDADGNAYCEPKNLEKFGKLMTAVIKHYGVKDGKQTKAPKTAKSASKPAKKAAGDAKKATKGSIPEVKPRAEAAVAMDTWYERWLQIICENTGREFHDGEAPTVGQLFTKDRRAKSGYVGLYCKVPAGRPKAVGYLHYKPRTNSMDMKLPLAPGDYNGIGKDSLKTLHPEDHRDGVFISVCKGLDESGVALGAEVIAQLVNSGTIELPEAP
ncbi:MAG: sigma-70 family RNA polymerase sigma factor [bacterium]